MASAVIDFGLREAVPLHWPTTASDLPAVLSSFLDHLSTESVQPPLKKRKLNTKVSTTPAQEDVCIADVRINLSSAGHPSSDSAQQLSVPVSLARYDPRAGTLDLRGIDCPGKHPPALILGRAGSLSAPNDLLLHHLTGAHDQDPTPTNPLWISSTLHQQKHNFHVHSRLLWRKGIIPYKSTRDNLAQVLRDCLQELPGQPAHTTPSPQLFYNSVHVTDSKAITSGAIQHPSVQAELFPFQKRTVDWLLRREGVKLQEDGSLSSTLIPENAIPSAFYEATDAYGDTCYASPLLGRVVHQGTEAYGLSHFLQGGVLSEEMGLGKTIEVISLMALHPRVQDIGSTCVDAYTASQTTVSSATLIICPPAILEQWREEINAHAPTMKVHVYESHDRNHPKIKQTLLSQDVVLTTYATLSREIWYADKPPERSLRHAKKYVAPKSPLMEILWWRVCLDEAQMLENGVSNAATVARRIPRCNAWAITGTPVRKNVEDLRGLLVFLRYEPFCDTDVWLAILDHDSPIFSEIFSKIALRHTKAQIREDLRLPPQKRITVTIPFSAIEEQHYSQMFESMCIDVGLDQEGGPTRGDWEMNPEKMRTWLTRLRQTCLHPEVGNQNRRALGHKTGPIRTVDQVLEVMIEQNETSLRAEERIVLNSKVVQGHLYAFSGNAQKALETYRAASIEAESALAECKEQLKQRQAEAAALESKKDRTNNDDTESESDTERNDGLSSARNRLRNALELQHVCTFFKATAYFQLKESKEEGSQEYKELEERESESYELAKVIRRNILQDSASRAQKLSRRVKESRASQASPLKIQYENTSGGIETRTVMSNLRQLKSWLNSQADQISEWRDKLTGLLTLSLLDQDEGVEMTGDEFEQTLKDQDEMYAYTFLLRAVLSDRHEMVTGQANFLLQHEIREALRAANMGDGHAPEITKAGLNTRRLLRPDPNEPTSLRGLVAELRGIKASLEDSGSRPAEAALIDEAMSSIQRISNEQVKDIGPFLQDIELYRTTMNARIDYYRQLQEVSDQVKPYAEEMSDKLDQQKLKAEVDKEKKSMDKLSEFRTKSRFLQHLRSSNTEERRVCIICQSEFEVGVLTVCAHEFCKDCIQMWMTQHRSCPVCKRNLHHRDLHEIVYKPKKLAAEEERHDHGNNTTEDSPQKQGDDQIYTSISQETLDEIKSIELPRSWGSKIDTLARHLLHLRTSDPGSKSVVFSQYRDFLSLLGRALTTCKIGHSDIADKRGIQNFKEDPSSECFLLHAKAESSGLNLVNATHVFLCEPLVNTAIELQAIARVHRIGQRRPTTVWMYLVRDTVEESIYDVSVARRLEHVQSNDTSRNRSSASATTSRAQSPGTADAEQRLDAANTLELQAAPLSKLLTKGQSGGEMVREDDLWRCLFGRGGQRANRGNAMRELQDTMGRELAADAAEGRRAS